MASAPTAVRLRLALTACRYPGGVLDRTPWPLGNDLARLRDAHFMEVPGIADGAQRKLRAWTKVVRSGGVVVCTGDSIYIDATAGLFDPAVVVGPGAQRAEEARAALKASLARAYRAGQNNPFKNVSGPGRLQAIDDHEIIDNWEPSLDAGRNEALQARMQLCRASFLENKTAMPRQASQGDSPVPLWGQTVERDVPFFIADTRTERSARSARSLHTASIMSRTQFDALLRWLEPTADEEAAPQAPRLRVVVSPSILLPRKLNTRQDAVAALRSDSWDGYPQSFHALLAALAEQRHLRCLFLAGDEHLPCVVRARVTRRGSKEGADLISIHTGAMYSPYPFANSVPEDFSDESSFVFDAAPNGETRGYRCDIVGRPWFPQVLEQANAEADLPNQRLPLANDGFMTVDIGIDASLAVSFQPALGEPQAWTG